MPKKKSPVLQLVHAAPELRKSEETRRRIRDAAFELFAERGYAATTMRAIAERAECSLGLIYRYFRQREDLALELFAATVEDDAARRADLVGQPLARAFAESVHRRIEALAGHRDALRALASAALDRDGPLSLLGPGTTAIRDQVIAGFGELIAHASDAPAGDDERARMARAMFVGQLFIVLAWLQDPSPQARHTHALIDTIGDTMQLLLPMMAFAAPLIERYDRLLEAFMAPA